MFHAETSAAVATADVQCDSAFPRDTAFRAQCTHTYTAGAHVHAAAITRTHTHTRNCTRSRARAGPSGVLLLRIAGVVHLGLGAVRVAPQQVALRLHRARGGERGGATRAAGLGWRASSPTRPRWPCSSSEHMMSKVSAMSRSASCVARGQDFGQEQRAAAARAWGERQAGGVMVTWARALASRRSRTSPRSGSAGNGRAPARRRAQWPPST